MPEEKIKTYTLKEIAEHASEDSLWLIINNGVYDLTKFKEEHPGGPEILTDWGGKEATEAFDDIGHSSDAKEQMKQYKIGVLCDADRKVEKKKGSQTASCFQKRYLIPLGVVVSALLLYKVYTRMNK